LKSLRFSDWVCFAKIADAGLGALSFNRATRGLHPKPLLLPIGFVLPNRRCPEFAVDQHAESRRLFTIGFVLPNRVHGGPKPAHTRATRAGTEIAALFRLGSFSHIFDRSLIEATGAALRTRPSRALIFPRPAFAKLKSALLVGVPRRC